jgi:hypothetical protein
VPTKMAKHPREPEKSGTRVFALPIKLYVYGDLLFELFHGNKPRRQLKTACEKKGTRLYRAGDVLFEILEGSQTRFDLEILWERLGFPVDAATVTQPDFHPLLAPHQKRPRRSSQQDTQLNLWFLEGQEMVKDGQ